ncbi:MAG: UDP-N-acetylglucosamine 1-carboxyvinyltransferase [Oscillospiraceae bacterium]|nr:UDP-N-acetylglucosamine 1-carboxyvinyltransferase [Oscillospiraceae bacterium]
MESLVIHGGTRLEGELRVQGAKNSALPILAATVVTGETSVLKRCPRLRDTDAAIRILRHIGCEAAWVGRDVIVRSGDVRQWSVEESMMREMRSSIIFLGAILARFGRAEVSAPGGCDIGMRPIDLHLSALRDLGVQTQECSGRLLCTAPQGLRGATVTLPFPSVGATENILLCAVCAKGETTLYGAAREPEIVDLAAFLNGCGADIRGAGTDTVRVVPQETFRSLEYTVRPDRIMAATYMAAAAVTGGTLVLRDAAPERLLPVLPYFAQTGCVVQCVGEDIALHAPMRLRSGKLVRTMPYPGFPTDFQASAMVMACLSSGTGVFVETIFENRYKHVPELVRMGAQITVQNNVAVVEGVPQLHGAKVRAADLRGGAALVTAGLAARGETVVSCVRHIDRGCENFADNLAHLGANIHRTEE